MTDHRPKKLFKVASEFNVATKSIVEALDEKGFTVANKPNTRITSEMYQVLEELYGVDKQKSREHEKSREAYESRRNQIRSQKNESVTIDSFLEPIDDVPLEPIDEPGSDLEPELEPEIESADEPAAEEIEVPAEEQGLDLEGEASEDLAVEKAEETDQIVDEEEAVRELEEAEKEEQVRGSVEVPEPSATEEASDPVEVSETEAEEETAETEETDAGSADAVAAEETSSDQDETDTEDKGVSAEDEDEDEDDDEEKIIRGSATRLKGTKVVGKIAFTSEDTGRTFKKRKRRKDQKADEESKAAKKRSDSGAAKSKSKKRRKGRRSKVDEEDVEKKMKETMQMMKSSDTAGSRRQRRRRQRREEREEELLNLEAEETEQEAIEVTEFVTVSDLAELLGVKPTDVITTCMSIGMMVSINQRLDASTIELVANEYGRDVDFVDAEELIEEVEEEEDLPEDLEPRAPIITVMGHVDHGKTSLLDYIRKTRVAAGEAGGITQHVGAYLVKTDDGRKITFLDTPGHEAFTAMRSRGAQATDIVILVIAADDSVMPQTIEAINHAKAAGVSIVVAINKIDKEGARPDRIKQQLAEHDVIVEEYGGSHQAAEVSAHTGEGIEDLLEKVLIESELMELKANPNRRASGVVLEARVDRGKGTVANVLIQNGSLEVGDPFVAGPVFGRVRAMENEHGKRIEKAGPSTPIQLMGFDAIPQAGDRLIVPKDEKSAKDIATQRQQLKREQNLRRTKHLTLDDLSRRLALGELSELNIIIKADVDGSIEALSGELQKLSTEEVAVNIMHTGSGAITESDVLLASASDGIIIGFQVRPTAGARKLAETEDIDIRLFSVIYDAVDEVRDALEGMLSPDISEKILGVSEVREIFKVSRIGTIAGCYVTDGVIKRNQPVRVIRDGVVIYDGEIDSLKRFKDDVKEVTSGYECGISIVGYNDLKVGDEIESYQFVEEKRKLEDAAR